jgi:two-component system response regulator HydG
MAKFKILVVDDESHIRKILKDKLVKEGYTVFTAADGEAALAEVSGEDPDLVLLDLRLPHLDGMEVLNILKEEDPERPVVVITAFGSIDTAVEAMKKGAYDFITKPLNPDHLILVVAKALERRVLLSQAAYLQEEEERRIRDLKEKYGIEEMIGDSPEIGRVIETAAKVAPTDATVLILGETGTGKELIAKVIHDLSPRKEHPYVAINCGAIPETLLESELFGHEKGSFTGAVTLQKGKFELAKGGTVFLDEVGELPLALQVKFFRVLESGLAERIGGREPIETNVRIVAATNRNLEESVERGEFREELYYRLKVVTLTLPPLRERGADIFLLAEHFLERFREKYRKEIGGLTPEAVKAMKKYRWPGNVRELQHKIERAVIVGEEERISATDLELDPKTAEPSLMKEKEEELKIEMIREALRNNTGNVSRSAEELGISRRTLQNLMKKHKIRREEFLTES